MQTFKDNLGRKWQIDLTPATVIRIRERSEGRFDLSTPNGTRENGKELWQRIDSSELEIFWELLWYVVEPEAEKRGISAERFGYAMAGDQLLDARGLFYREWEDMFNLLGKPLYAGAIHKIATVRGAAIRKAQDAIIRAKSHR